MMKRIKILKNGPYLITGSLPLKKNTIRLVDGQRIYSSDGSFPTASEYRICRCGQSKTKVYCDGTHSVIGFKGTEISSHLPYVERAELTNGQTINLLDDHRCANAKFCHRKQGSVWELIHLSDDPALQKEAIIGAADCPTGRLTALTKQNEPYEYAYQQELIVLEDETTGLSAGLFVRGSVPIESSDGEQYEIRNRVTLCRCGQSANQPFCDASHERVKFKG